MLVRRPFIQHFEDISTNLRYGYARWNRDARLIARAIVIQLDGRSDRQAKRMQVDTDGQRTRCELACLTNV